MRKLYLHIGLGKTGSSALQSWLSLNAEMLSSQGIDYADTVPEVKFGESLSGNGSALHLACVNKAFDEVENLLNHTYFFRPGHSVAIISCELLQGLRPATIAELKAICDRNAIEVTVIAYVRSVYEALYSTYTQFVKRGGCTHRFGESPSDLSFDTSLEFLQRYLDVFGDHLVVLNYDEAKKDIYGSFSSVTGIELKGLKKLEARINRSLSFQEVETLRRVNELHQGAFSTLVSNHVIALSPSISTPVFYEEALVQQVRESAAEGVSWINETFALQPPLATDRYTGDASERAQAPGYAEYRPILQWALGYEALPAQMEAFAGFLKEFAAVMLDYSDDNALALLRKASLVQKAIPAEEAGELEEGGELRAGPVAPRFLMSYFHDVNAPEIDAEDSPFEANFYAWLDLVDRHSVGGTLCPLQDTRILGASPASLGQLPMTGYSVVEAESIDDVLALAERCPLLDIGGAVEVSRIVMLNQPWGTPSARESDWEAD